MDAQQPDSTFETRVLEVISRILQVPSEHRSFTMGRSEAQQIFSLGEQALEVLVESGLPHRRTGPELLLDQADLENIVLGTQLPSHYWSVTRILTNSLRSSGPLPGATCQVEFSCSCPDPGHPGECDFSLDPRFGAAPATGELPGGGHSFQVQAVLANEDHDFDASFRDVVRAATSLSFHKIPETLSDDMGFLRETRLADCRSASRYLVEVCAASGLTANPASGFFVGTPFPNPHDWFEVLVAGRWVAADPFFLHAVHGWGLADPARWPPTRSPRNVLWRLGREHTMELRPVRHRGVPVDYKMAAHWRG